MRDVIAMLPEKNYESIPEHSHSQFAVAESLTFNSTSLNYFGRQTKSARKLAAVCMLSLHRHGRANVACRIFRYGRSLPDAANTLNQGSKISSLRLVGLDQ